MQWVCAHPLAPPGCCTRYCLQVGAAGQPCSVGDTVDCFINDGWWENSRVVALQRRGAQLLVKVVGEEKPVPVQLANTRPMLRFAGGQWSRVQADTPAAAAPAAAADGSDAGVADAALPDKKSRSRQPGGSKKQQAAAAAAASAAAGEQPQDQPAAETEREAAEAEAAAEEPTEKPPQKKRRGRPGGSGKKQQAAAAVAAAVAAGAGGDDAGAAEEAPSAAAAAAAAAVGAGTPAGEPASGGTSPQPPTTAKSKRPASTGGGSAGAAGGKKAPPVYHVPADFAPAVLPGADLSSLQAARQSVPLAVCRRFLGLRRQVAEDQYPAYETTSTHLKGCDVELLAQALAEIMHT